MPRGIRPELILLLLVLYSDDEIGCSVALIQLMLCLTGPRWLCVRGFLHGKFFSCFCSVRERLNVEPMMWQLGARLVLTRAMFHAEVGKVRSWVR